jgi:DNA-binding transcriptional MerR regulator
VATHPSPPIRRADVAGERHGSATLWPVAQAATRIGVAQSTLRAWERRYGLAPSGRTDGGHRRYSAYDIAGLQRFRRLTALGVAPAQAATLLNEPAPDPSHARRSGEPRADLEHAIERLDMHRMEAAARSALNAMGIVRAWTDVFVPCLQGLGDGWAASGRGVEREHMTTATLRRELDRYGRRAGRRAGVDGAMTVLAAATGDERHTLPLDALVAALAERGVGATMTEAMPTSALVTLVEDMAPTVVVLFTRDRQPTDLRTLRAVAAHVPFVCAAGQGWQVNRLPAHVPHLPDLPVAVETLATITARHAPSADRTLVPR